MWVDYDRDGRLDLFVCRYVQWTLGSDGIDFESLSGQGKSYTGPTNRRGQSSLLYRNLGQGGFGQGVTCAERPLLFRNLGPRGFQEVGLQAGSALAQPIVARGMASADIDLDGDVDVLITAKDAAPTLLRNDSPKQHSLRLVLSGAGGNTSAVGAVVKVKLRSTGLRRTVKSGSSYLSQSELPLTLGLRAESREPRAESREPR